MGLSQSAKPREELEEEDDGFEVHLLLSQVLSMISQQGPAQIHGQAPGRSTALLSLAQNRAQARMV